MRAHDVLDFNERLEVPKERFSTVALFARGTWTEEQRTDAQIEWTAPPPDEPKPFRRGFA